MKKIPTYISEKLKISSNIEKQYHYFPKNRAELEESIHKLLHERGPNADLNDINTSKITDMLLLFSGVDSKYIENIDISRWDVSHVTDMYGMFRNCKNFNCDLSRWNVSQVTDMECMFADCESFNSDISQWDISSCQTTKMMFYKCKSFNQDLSQWKPINVETMEYMFYDCKEFNCDLSKWEDSIKKCKNTSDMFKCCFSMKKFPDWYMKFI